MKEFKQCTRCIMNNKSDDTISFDENGHCSYCTNAIEMGRTIYFPNSEGDIRLQKMLSKIKRRNSNKPYDCIMGISGGLDSSYLAYLGAVKWGLRILAVHVDDGFDEPVAVSNIEKLCRKANIKLNVIRPDKEQFNELTRAYMLAGVPNIAIPQDNILFACLYKFARENKINTFLSGGNYALECILQKGNTYDAMDKKNILAINNKFGRNSVDKLPLLSNQRILFDKFILGIKSLRPLNYIDYNRAKAIQELYDFCRFEYYGNKHLENTLTKFIQLYWFYKKFGVDKRTSHFSSMIVSGQMTREEALDEIKKPLYSEKEIDKDINMILKALDLSREEFDSIMKEKSRQHTDYPTSSFMNNMRSLRSLFRKLGI